MARTDFEATIQTALVRYAEQTGKDLSKHPVALKIDGCKSAGSIFDLFQDEAKKFDNFRNSHAKLDKFLRPVVEGVYSLSTSPVLRTVAGHASPSKFLCFRQRFFNAISL